MIEPLIFFALGVLVAGLIWLLFLPAFWRRAVRLTRRDLERALPLSRNEIEAERDRLRAQNAVTMRRLEARLEAMGENVRRAKAETGERLLAEAGWLSTIAETKAAKAQLETERDSLEARLGKSEQALHHMKEARDLGLATISGLELHRDALASNLAATVELAEERRIALEENELRIDQLREAVNRETQRSASLRAEIQALQIQLRERDRQLSALDNEATLARIRRGEMRAFDSERGELSRLRPEPVKLRAASPAKPGKAAS